MGTWGPNNFENDRAHDYLIEFLDKLIEEIRTDMTTLQRTSALSEVGEYRIMPTLDIFLTLNDAFSCPPRIDAVTASQWRQDYLELFDKSIGTYPEQFKIERRKAVVETFDRLDNLIKEWDI